jgi:hypothetical protein
MQHLTLKSERLFGDFFAGQSREKAGDSQSFSP